MMESWYSRPALRRGGAVDGHGGHAPRVRGLAPVIFSSVPIRFQGRSNADNMLRLLCAKTKEALLSSAVHTVVQTPIVPLNVKIYKQHVSREGRSRNFSPFVARKIWRRRGASPLCGRAHRLQRHAPLRGPLVRMATIFDLLQTVR